MGLLSRLFSSETRRPAATKPAKSKNGRAFGGVEIVAQGAGCQAVETIAGERFLTTDVPSLPLPDCDQSACECRYRRFTDRRTDVRRDVDVGIGIASQMYNDGCRRSKDSERRGGKKDLK